jgi:hypothetical protein
MEPEHLTAIQEIEKTVGSSNASEGSKHHCQAFEPLVFLEAIDTRSYA